MPFFETLDLGTLVLVAGIAYATAVVHSVGGFAGGLLLTIGLAPVLGVKETIPVCSLAMVVSNVARVWVFWRWINWPAVVAIFTAALPGIVLGAILYISLPVHWIALVLGLFLIGSLVLRRRLARRNYKVGLGGLRLVAVPYGLLSGTVIGAGLMLGPFLLGAGLVGETLVATVAAQGLALNVTKSLVFGASPLLGTEQILKGLLIGLCTMPGAYSGRWIVSHTPIRLHTRYLEAVILAGAVYFLWQAREVFA